MIAQLRSRRLTFALFALVSAPLLATPADSVRIRVAGFREMGAAFKAVNDGLRGSEVQTILIQQSARQIRNASQAQYQWFPAGSGPQPGLRTHAKPEIWAQAAAFRSAQDGLARQAEAFQRAAATGDATAIRNAARALGGACKSCHDRFREPQS
jgi:cytochrome c556